MGAMIQLDNRNLGVACHLGAYLAYLLPPIGQFVVPVVVLFMTDADGEAREHALESLNFQISVLLWSVILAITIIGIPLVFVLAIYSLIAPLLAALAASRGEPYEYIGTLRLLK